MTALSTLRFDRFILRPAGSQLGDIQIAQNWTAKDQAHAGKVDPIFWLEQRPGIDSYLFHDDKGPLLFLKTVQLIQKREDPAPKESKYKDTVEIHIQFMPRSTEEDFERTRNAMVIGLEWLERVLVGNGIEEVFFDSEDLRLIAFCVKRLGFVQQGTDRLVKPLRITAAIA